MLYEIGKEMRATMKTVDHAGGDKSLEEIEVSRR